MVIDRSYQGQVIRQNVVPNAAASDGQLVQSSMASFYGHLDSPQMSVHGQVHTNDSTLDLCNCNIYINLFTLETRQDLTSILQLDGDSLVNQIPQKK